MTERDPQTTTGDPGDVEPDVIEDLDAAAEDADEILGGYCPSPGRAVASKTQ